MTPNEIKEKSPAELTKLIGDLNEELFRLKMKKAGGQLEKNHRLKEIRKEIARIKTHQSAKKGA